MVQRKKGKGYSREKIIMKAEKGKVKHILKKKELRRKIYISERDFVPAENIHLWRGAM